MDSSAEQSAELRTRIRQQEVVADLGQRALDVDDVDRLLREATVAVTDTLGTDYCEVLELQRGGDEALLRQGVEWRDGLVGGATVPTDLDSPEGAALRTEEPVVAADLRSDDRLSRPELLAGHGVTSGLCVTIGSREDPWGVLGTYAVEHRKFTEHDVAFVRNVANVLASAVANERTANELEEIYGRISDAFFALDRNWRFTYLNKRAHELINPEDRSLVGEDIWEAFPAATDRKFADEYERAMYDQETVAFEEYYPEPLDSWFEVRAYPSETGLSVYFRDISGRKERERELERTERRFEAIFEDPNILVGLLEPDGTVLDINGTAMEYIDADLEDVTGDPFWETPWWGEGDAVEDDVREWTERAAAGEYVDFQADLTRPDGQRYTLEGYFRPVTDDDGEVVSIIVSDRDVSERKAHERRLEESERRYRALAENFPNGLVTLLDRDLRYTLAAGRGFDRIPLEPDELEGRPFHDVWDDDTAEALEPLFRGVLDGEESAVELSYAGRDWIVHGVPITDERGEVFAGMTMAQDITERREQRRQLEESERRYRTLVENFPSGAVGLFDENLEYTAVGGELLDATGIDKADRIGSRVSELYPDELVAEVEPYFRAALEGETNSFEVEYHDRYLSGHTLPVSDGDGEVFAGMLVVQDVTERREAERELRESEARFRMLAENLEEIVWMATADATEFVYLNPAFEEVWGLDRERLYDEPLSFLEAVHPEDRERVREEFSALPEREFDEEFRIRRPDGDVRWVRARGARVSDEDGEMVRTIGIGEDITERKEHERALEESNERLEQFAYAASHDLQEPLRMVSSYLQLIDRRYGDDLDEDAEEFLAYAVDGAERMREMIDALLQYSRVETSGAPLEPVELDRVLEAVLDDLQLEIAETDAEISAEPLPRVEGDANQLRQLLQNLLDNALTYSGEEPPRVDVSATRTNGAWEISISDEGIGIDPDETESIFEVFQRLHGREEHAGTGIGLALCQRIVERHGGEITVDSEPGEGATFSFTLPAADDA